MSLLRELRLKSKIYEFLLVKAKIQQELNEYLCDSNVSSEDKADLHELLEEVKLLDLI